MSREQEWSQVWEGEQIPLPYFAVDARIEFELRKFTWPTNVRRIELSSGSAFYEIRYYKVLRGRLEVRAWSADETILTPWIAVSNQSRHQLQQQAEWMRYIFGELQGYLTGRLVSNANPLRPPPGVQPENPKPPKKGAGDSKEIISQWLAWYDREHQLGHRATFQQVADESGFSLSTIKHANADRKNAPE